MDTTQITIKKVDAPEIQGTVEDDVQIMKVLHDIFKELRVKKPQWKYRLTSNHHLSVFQDAENIGSIEVESRWSRQIGQISKLKIKGHNFEHKKKGDEARRTDKIKSAIDIITTRFRGRSPKELLEKYANNLHSQSTGRIFQHETEIRDALKEGEEALRELAKHYHKYKEFNESSEAKKLFEEIGALEEQLEEASRSNTDKKERAVLVFQRPTAWQVISQDEESTMYLEFKDIPEYIGGKLAVLGMVEDAHKYVPNVGMKVNGRVFWVLV